MWGRDIMEPQELCDSMENVRAAAKSANILVTMATQTDTGIDLPAMEKFVLSNPRLILNMLGIIEPAYQIECELQPQTLIPIPEADVSSPEISSPRDVNEFGAGSESVQWSPQNNNNRHDDNCRSTDALLGDNSYDCLKASDASLNELTETVNFSIVREGSVKSLRLSQSGSSNNLLSSSSTNTCAPRGSVSDGIARVLMRKPSWKEGNHTGLVNKVMADTSSSTEVMDDTNPDFDELSEKCALLCNDVRKNSRSSTSDIQKRNHLGMPRPPFNYRFSAGDADKLEKGIRNIPSTRSLKES